MRLTFGIFIIQLLFTGALLFTVDQSEIDSQSMRGRSFIDYFTKFYTPICSMKCSENEELATKPNVTMNINGCGSYNIHFDMQAFGYGFLNDCCNMHDICYRTCSASKDFCDDEFKKCLMTSCKENGILNSWGYFSKKMCKSLAKIMDSLVENFGCKAYKKDQEIHCECVQSN